MVESVAIYHVVVRDLRTGRVLRKVPTGTLLDAKPGFVEVGVGPVKSMVLKSDGAVAWVAFDGERSEVMREAVGHEDYVYDLYALDKTGERLLASGSELEPSSLKLAGGMLSWTDGGKPFSAVVH